MNSVNFSETTNSIWIKHLIISNRQDTKQVFQSPFSIDIQYSLGNWKDHDEVLVVKYPGDKLLTR